MTTPSYELSLSGVSSEATRITKANREHFLILNLLFLLPFSLLILINIGSTSNSTFLRIIYLIASLGFSISATGTITYSAFHGYYNRPLELIPTLKSLSSSFIPLLSTSTVLQLICFPIFVVWGGMLPTFVYIWLESFTYWTILPGFMFFVCLIYLLLNWFISNVIVVVESKWGLGALRRSAYLMKGMKLMALKMIAWFGVLSYNVFLSIYFYNSSKSDSVYVFWQWLILVVVGLCWMTMLMGHGLVATVVLYIYCMKIHGELGTEIQPEYVSLLVDDDGTQSVAAAQG